jgi:predicted ATPase/DNA-binding NarL/FixJ family response regulator
VKGQGVLPLRLTSFIGRERAMADIDGLLGQARLVTLAGPPGCGKTRLAIETVRQRDDRARRHVFVGLDSLDPATATPADAVIDAVALSLGVIDGGARPLLDGVLSVVDRPVLVVLDNCEHVRGACAEVVEQLLGRLPMLSVLATSREALGIDGEMVWKVPPLTLPVGAGGPLERLEACESGRLVLDRVQLTRPGPPLTDGQADLMVTICTALEGIPFDLELAVGRLDVLDLDTLAAHLTRGDITVLRSTAGDRRAHRSSSDSVAWSYELLSAPERRLLRRLTVFAATFGLDAAHAVGGEPGQSVGEVGEILAKLARTSLIQPEGRFTPRFRLLPSIRAFCADDLGEAEAEIIADRHLRHHVELADRLSRSVSGPTELATFLYQAAASLEDLRKAADRAVASDRVEDGLRLVAGLRWLWIDIGRLPEGRRRIAELLAAAAPADIAVRGRAALTGATLALFAADPLDLHPLAVQARDLGREAGDPDIEGEALILLGWAAVFLDPPGALAPLHEGLAVLQGAGDNPFAQWAVMGIGVALGNEGRLSEAVVQMRRAVEADAAFSWLSPFALAALGYLETLQGDLAAAEGHLLLALDDATPDTFQYQVGQWYGLLRTYQGRYEEAGQAFAAAYEGAAGSGGAFVPGWLHYGIFEYGRENLDRAERLINDALVYFQAMTWRLFEAQAERYLGDVAARRGDLAAAGRHRRRALSAADASRNPIAVAIAATGMALQQSEEGDLAGARSRLSRALRSATDASYVLGAVDALEVFALLAAHHPETAPPADGLRALAAAQAQRTRSGYVRLPVDQAGLDGARKALIDAVGEEAESIWQEGLCLSIVSGAAIAARGRRRQPRPRFGPESLTRHEREVAELVAEGLTNEEIAVALVKSRATVKHQLSSVLTKLGLRGRGEVGTFVERQRARDAW